MTMRKSKPELIKLIHIAKSKLGMADDDYRSLLRCKTGKTTSTDMSIVELEKVLSEMQTKGFKIQKKSNRRMSQQSGRAATAEIDKMVAIWITMSAQSFVKDGSEAALDKYVARMTAKLNGGNGIESVRWLRPRQAVHVLESLKKWHVRLMLNALDDMGCQTEILKSKGYERISQRFVQQCEANQ